VPTIAIDGQHVLSVRLLRAWALPFLPPLAVWYFTVEASARRPRAKPCRISWSCVQTGSPVDRVDLAGITITLPAPGQAILLRRPSRLSASRRPKPRTAGEWRLTGGLGLD
jgi:hypothetical protein